MQNCCLNLFVYTLHFTLYTIQVCIKAPYLSQCLQSLCVLRMLLIAKFLLLLQVIPLVFSDTYQVSEGVYSFISDSGYVSMFILTGEGVMVVEPINSKHSALMLEAIGTLTTEPVKYVFYSHNHWDHTSGGQVFRDVGATIISHEY